jgi:hypothetical protein
MAISQNRRKSQPAPKRSTPTKATRTFWDDLADIGRKIPKSELKGFPRDAAARFDEYFDDVTQQP